MPGLCRTPRIRPVALDVAIMPRSLKFVVSTTSVYPSQRPPDSVKLYGIFWGIDRRRKLSESVGMLAAQSPSGARRDALESLLRTKKLDGTLTSNRLPMPDAALAPTGVSGIDRSLGGGLPRGHLSEIVGRRSMGRTSLVHAALAAATSRGEVTALVDPTDMFDAVSAAEAGVEFTRLLWVRGPATITVFESAIDAALKAFNLILQAGGFGLVVLDLADVPMAAIRRLPFTTWLRLERVLEGRDTAALLVADEPVARSTRGKTLQLANWQVGKLASVGSETLPIPTLAKSPTSNVSNSPTSKVANSPTPEFANSPTS